MYMKYDTKKTESHAVKIQPLSLGGGIQ